MERIGAKRLKLYDFVMKYRNKIHAYLDGWEAYQATKVKLKAMKESIKKEIFMVMVVGLVMVGVAMGFVLHSIPAAFIIIGVGLMVIGFLERYYL